MSNNVSCITVNRDVSGVGVRTSIYTQNLLGFIPAFIAILNDGQINIDELKSLEAQSSSILIMALSIIIATFLQITARNGNLDDLNETKRDSLFKLEILG
ncbi:hypothetical protein DL96DRAFT_1716968 [Flagelloscypha sp. PMI_526]|nr:hypothetical protein DL96DRAFT_1716968 [Flagelloscypha sp. PMI_526]